MPVSQPKYIGESREGEFNTSNSRSGSSVFENYVDQTEYIQEMDIKTNIRDNMWSAPMDYNRARSVSMLLNNKNSALLEEKAHSYTLMKPEDYSPLLVPFQLPGSTKANPVELPPEFTLSLQRRGTAIMEMKGLIESVPDNSKDELRRIIEEKFRGWLVQTGNIEQVNDLINFHLQ